MIIRYEFKALQGYWVLLQIIDRIRKEAGIDIIEVSRFEIKNHKLISDERRGKRFMKKLERKGGITIIKEPYPSLVVGENNYYKIKILPKFKSILRRIKTKYTKMASERDNNAKKPINNNLLFKNSKGDFFYNNNLINLSKNSIPYDILDIMLSKHDQKGFVSYEDIDKYLVARERPVKKNIEQRNKRILNAITNERQGLFRFAEVNGHPFKNETLDGRKLIDTERGKGLILNNPKI